MTPPPATGAQPSALLLKSLVAGAVIAYCFRTQPWTHRGGGTDYRC